MKIITTTLQRFPSITDVRKFFLGDVFARLAIGTFASAVSLAIGGIARWWRYREDLRGFCGVDYYDTDFCPKVSSPHHLLWWASWMDGVLVAVAVAAVAALIVMGVAYVAAGPLVGLWGSRTDWLRRDAYTSVAVGVSIAGLLAWGVLGMVYVLGELWM